MRRLTREEKFMRQAVKAAKRGLSEGEVPIGAVVVFEDKGICTAGSRYNAIELFCFKHNIGEGHFHFSMEF